MGYEIKYEDIRNVRTTAISQITLWQQQLEEILESFQNLGNNMGMEGETAASIELGFYEVIGKLEQLNDRVGSYENSHLTDRQPIRDYLQSIQSFISGQSGKGKVIISTYRLEFITAPC